jgi:hypothetical protein
VSSSGNGHFQKSESDQSFARFDGENFSLVPEQAVML